MTDYHTPVLLQEILEALKVSPAKRYVDATLGGGGHSLEIAKAGGEVLAIDQDQEAIEYVEKKIKDERLTIKEEKLRVVKGNFKDIKEIAHSHGFEKVDGILFDLGVSSHQLDEAERGFSFGKDGPLDMRMDKDLGVTAKDLLQVLSKKELAKLFFEYGEEPRGNEIADKIVRVREKEAITTTKQLADIILKIYGKNYERIHPATRVFQALRIAVNNELEDIEAGLVHAVNLLAPAGRLVVLSFHSLEDRIVKNAFLAFANQNLGKVITKKPIMATDGEIEKNARSRSAKLRIFESI